MNIRKIITLIICASLFLTGCTPINMSNLTGKGALANSDVVFPKEDSENKTSPDTETTQKPTDNPVPDIEKPNNPVTQDKNENPADKNKTGNITFKQYVIKGKTSLPYTTPVLIKTTEEYQKTISSLTSYSNISQISETVINEYFLLFIPVNNTNETWEYFIDSVKNDKTLHITVMCEKKANTQNDGTNMYIIAAISRKDIPNIPNISQINIRHNSYTIEQ